MRILRSLFPIAVLFAFTSNLCISGGLAAESPLTAWLAKVDWAVRKYDDWAVAARNAAILESLKPEEFQSTQVAQSDLIEPRRSLSEERVRLNRPVLTLLREEYRAYDRQPDEQVNAALTPGLTATSPSRSSKQTARSPGAIRLSDYWNPITSRFCIYAEKFDRIVAEGTVAIGGRFVNRTAGFWGTVWSNEPDKNEPVRSASIPTDIITNSQVAFVFGRSVIPSDVTVSFDIALMSSPSDTWDEVRTLAMKLYSVPGLRKESLSFSEDPFVKNRFSAKRLQSETEFVNR